MIGAVMYATRALLPPMLQNLMNYPVATTGLVTAPSGAGTMIAMMVAGRLLKRIDARLMLLAGFLISAFALWQMMHYTIVLSASDIVWPGVIQGFGLGLVFVPLLGADVLDAHTRTARRRHRNLQPDAQYRQQYRHLDRADADDAQHAGRARRPRGQRQRLQPGDAADARHRLDLRHGDAQSDRSTSRPR